MADSQQDVDNNQYNQITDAYSILYPSDGESPSTFPLAAIERHQVYLAMSDPSVDIRGKRVLDLACGSGYYANQYLKWGAASVTGMDISTGMLEAGRRSAADRGFSESELKFVHGDATDENLVIDGAPFDLVTGCWLLNYAPNAATMTKMYKFIARNLRPGGYWVGLSVPPLLSDAPYEADMLNTALAPDGVWGKHGNLGKVLKAMPNGDGYLIRVELGTEVHKLKACFDCYHLSLKIFEQACHDSEMFERPEWKDFVIPGQVKTGAYEKDHWNSLCLWPHCRVFTAKRCT
ncbi:hypothetical protein N0V82_002985 [Gnomoniopsis sp. IMI 355080]|nr:hypothetical protein N0V82_002985 [Gnomoniopsis sp. IMI 355080]